MVETVTITALGHRGDGIAQTDSGRIYVGYTLPREKVEVERTGARGRLLRIVSGSPDRIGPICRHFTACGGCALQHMARDAYLAWKRKVVTDCLAHQDIEVSVEPVVPAATASRRRAIFSAIRTSKGTILGFHRKGAEEIVAVEGCPILAPEITDRLETLRRIAALAIGRTQARVIVVASDNGLDVAIEGGRRLGHAELEALGAFADDQALARLTVDGTQIFLNRQPEVRADGLSLLPVPGGFVQATADAEAAVAATVIEHVGDATPVADLFAGIGTFALRLSRHAEVTAVEGSAELLGAIGSAWNAMPGLKAVTLQKRDLFRNPLATVELNRFGAVVFDPPAAGARTQAQAIAASDVPKVVAVSCNPATLARDARILVDGGYRPIRVAPVDQFLFSAEIEAVATFEK